MCRHKKFWRGTKCSQIFGLAQTIWTGTKHFGTCKRHKYQCIMIHSVLNPSTNHTLSRIKPDGLGIYSKISWEFIKNSLGIYSKFFGDLFKILWEFFNNSLGIFQEFPRFLLPWAAFLSWRNFKADKTWNPTDLIVLRSKFRLLLVFNDFFK